MALIKATGLRRPSSSPAANAQIAAVAMRRCVRINSWSAFRPKVPSPSSSPSLTLISTWYVSPDMIGFAEAAAMGCRLTTAFRGLIDRADLRPGEWLSVHGCGGVGISAVMIAAAIGAQIVAIDVNRRCSGAGAVAWRHQNPERRDIA